MQVIYNNNNLLLKISKNLKFMDRCNIDITLLKL